MCNAARVAADPRRVCNCERERDLCVPAGLCAHLCRVRHRPGQRLAVPLHRGAVRRRGLCADLSAVPGHHGPAHHGHGVFRGPGQPEEHPGLLSGPGAQGEQVALVRLVRHGGQLPADDVLHHHRRLAAALLLQGGCRRIPGPGCRRCGKRFRRHAGQRRNSASVHGHRGGAGYADLQPRPEKRRGEGQQGHDALPAGPAGSAGRPRPYPSRCHGGREVLPGAQLPQPDVRCRRQLSAVPRHL